MVAIPAPPAPEGVASVFRFTVNTVKNQAMPMLSSDAQFYWEAQGRMVHGATIPMEPFYIDESPVTCGAWDAFVKESGYTPSDPYRYLHNWDPNSSTSSDSSSSTTSTPTLPPALAEVPVTYVSFKEATTYCAFYKKRLPHDWEWQYAAQGNDGRDHTWLPNATCAKNMKGDRSSAPGPSVPTDHCAAPVTISRTLPGAPKVGSYSPQGDSPFGVKDLLRSVWQFTDEVTSSHSRAALVRGGSNWRAGFPDGKKNNIGSHWYFAPTSLPLVEHNKYELMSDSYERAGTLGFRCVADVLNSATRCDGKGGNSGELCGRWDGPPVFNTSLSAAAAGGEWARWAVGKNSTTLTTVGPSAIPKASRRIGAPQPLCGGRLGGATSHFGAANTSVVTLGWSGGDSSRPDATNTTGAVSSSSGFEIEVSGGGIEDGETFSIWGGIYLSNGASLNATAIVTGGDGTTTWTQLVPMHESAHESSDGALRTDALMRFAWPSVKGTTLKVMFASSMPTPTPTPTPTPPSFNYTTFEGKSCGVALSAATAAKNVAACEARCGAKASCSCAVWHEASSQCELRSTCVTTACVADAGATSLVKQYLHIPGRNCYNKHGATSLDKGVPKKNVSVAECIAWCEGDPLCTAAEYKTSGSSDGNGARTCWRRANVVVAQCLKEAAHDVYIRTSTPPGVDPGSGSGALLYGATLNGGGMPPRVGY